MYNFDAVKIKNECVEWIKRFFDKNGKDCNAVIGISGGKDSSIVAALCTEALGVDRVIGVLMPNGVQDDIDIAQALVNYLGIKSYTINIKDIVKAFNSSIEFEPSEQSEINLPPRIRMAMLYYISQTHNGRVVNTCNLSEDLVGYFTIYGDGAGDFSPCKNLTVQEIKEIGRLCLPSVFVDKIPSDGLCNKTDEENLGFTYSELDEYIREGTIKDREIKRIIDSKISVSMFKRNPMESYNPGIEIKW